MTDKEGVYLEVKDRVGCIILNAPPDNRMTRHFFSNLEKVLEKVVRLDIGALVFYSSGRHFSAGADVEGIKQRFLEPYLNGSGFEKALEQSIVKDCALFSAIEALPFPVIGALSGLCVGSGLELALACNIRICSKDCLMGSPEINWGLITGCNGSLRLERILGKSRALEFIITGEMVNSTKASEMGLINTVVDNKNLIPRAIKLAQLFAEKERAEANYLIKKALAF